MGFDTEMTQTEIAFVAGCLGAMRLAKDFFKKKPVEPESTMKSNKKKKLASNE